VASLLSWLGNTAKTAVNDVSHAFSGQAPHPVQTMTPQAQAQIQNARYGVLAHNPQAQQQFMRQQRQPVAPRINIASELIHNAPKALEGFGLGAGRSLVGTGQAVSGLYDLATPGKGTNRFSKALDTGAKKIDQFATQQHVNPAYKVGQVTGDTAQFLTPGTYLKGASEAGKVGKGAKIAGSLAKYDKAVNGMKFSGDIVGRTAGTIAKSTLHSGGLANTAVGTLQDLGQGASKGQQITPGRVATDIGMNAGLNIALPLAGQAGREAVNGVKAADRTVKAGRGKLATNAGIDQEIAQRTRTINSLKQRQAQTPIGSVASENHQRVIDYHQTVINNLKQSKEKLTLPEKVMTTQPGMSMKAVHSSDLTPEQNNFIEQYAQMKKDLGQGNGVNIMPDGTRTTNNFRTAEQSGKRMTNADWFDHAKQELESGKGAYGASEEYRALHQPEAPLEIPAGFEAPTAPVSSATPKSAPLKPVAKRQLVASRGTGGGSLPDSTPKVNNSLTQGAKTGRQNLSPETTKLTQGKHDVRNTQNLADTSAANVDKLPTNTAIEQAHGMMDVAPGMVSDQQTGFIAKAIEKADSEATKARQAGNLIEADRLSRESADLHNRLSEHAVARGQASQALSMLYNRSPQGLYHSAIRDLGKAGVEITPEVQTKLQGLADAIKMAGDPAAKVDAVGNFHKAVSDTMPQNISDKLIGVWKAGLLSGVKTQQGNAISNAIFGSLKKASDVPATAVDKLMSVFTGQRTKTTTLRGEVRGGVEGIKNGASTMKTGIDRRGAGDKYEQHAEINFKHPVLNKTLGTAVRTVFRGMNAADQPFWYAAFKNSMYDQAKAAGVTKGLKGSELTKFMNETVKNPNDAMANTALSEANKSTLNYDTLASKGIQAIHTGIDKVQSLNGRKIPQQYRTMAHAALNVLAPFVRVPTAFLSRTIDFTPLGTGREVFQQIATKQFDQRALSQAIGEGLTGTGAIAIGIALTQHNMLSGDYPKNDAKEVQRWKAEGITPNSVKLGGKWVSLNYLGPLGLLFNAGNKLENAKGEGSANQAGQAIAGFGQGLMGQSFLQGFSGFSNAIQDPQRNLMSFVKSQAGSVVPNISNDVANVTDSMQRQANNPLETIQSRIPVVRNKTLPVKQDVYGNPLKQPAGPLGTLIGVKPSNSLTNSNPVISEVNRLHGVDPNNNDLQVTPTPVTSVTIPGANKGDKSTTLKLNNKQKYDIQKQVGQNIQSTWDKLIKTPEYQAMSDTEKAKQLTNARQDATELATRKYVIDNNLGSYAKSASKSAQALASGNLDKYTNGTAGGTTVSSKINPQSQKVLKDYNSLNADQRKQKAYSDPAYDYNVAVAKYANDKANGTLTKASDITARAAIDKALVGKDYSKDTRDLYGLSKSEIYDFITSDPNGKKYANDLANYDKALKDNGLITTLKFKNGFGSSSTTKTSSGTTRRTYSVGKAAKRISPPNINAIRAKRVKMTTPKFSAKMPKSPSFKTKRASVPKFAYKTPKVTKKKAIA
jgi:hypothetical protein